MPELPEVHTIAADLKRHLVGWKINETKANPSLKLPAGFTQKIRDKKIFDVYRIAKNIAISLGEDATLIFHLAMTGRLLVRSPTFKGTDSYLKLILILKKASKTLHLKFCDKRGFGKVQLLDEEQLKKFNKKYGLDPLSTEMTLNKFISLLKGKNVRIKTFLLDQTQVAGIGNAYATEALWKAQMHPETKTKDITPKEAQKLLKAIRDVLKQGIENRGLSISDYVDIFGKPGKQQNYLNIYKQKTCPRCKSKVVFKNIGGRGTYFCPQCQLPH